MICELCKKNEVTPVYEPWCHSCAEINSWVRSNPAVARKVLRRVAYETKREKFGANFSDGDLRDHCLSLDLGTRKEVCAWGRATLIAKLRGTAFEEHAYT